jgi:hypothetical protein
VSGHVDPQDPAVAPRLQDTPPLLPDPNCVARRRYRIVQGLPCPSASLIAEIAI